MNLCKLLILSLLFLLLVLTACGPVEESPDWAYADLRLLDPTDGAVIPGQDLVALYVRTTGDKLQLRLDLLDLAPLPEMDLYLALDTLPGGSSWLPIEAGAAIEWDVLLTIPAAGSIQVHTPGAMPGSLAPLEDAGIRVLRNPARDSLEINLNQSAIWNGMRTPRSAPPFKLQVFTTPPGIAARPLISPNQLARKISRPPRRPCFWPIGTLCRLTHPLRRCAAGMARTPARKAAGMA